MGWGIRWRRLRRRRTRARAGERAIVSLRSVKDFSFAPTGLASVHLCTHGLRRGLRSFAASRLGGLLAGALGLLFGGDFVDNLAFFSAVLGAMEAVVEGGEFDVRLEPVRIVFG